MRIIKLGIISFIFFFGLLLLMSLFMPSKVRLSKAVDVNANTAAPLIKYIQNLKQWPAWHPAFEKGVVSNQALTITGTTDTSFSVIIQHAKGRSVINTWQMHHLGSNASRTLQWTMDFQLSWWPWHKFSSLFYEGTYGRMMQQGLANLKKWSDSTAATNQP